ncbi:hypothetical protein XELAEV_18014725mg [Xenopus laevis]|uniref:Uncharacterized protein n=1 Tax=Xenopus laevis TaxID=8355 RepID=A0A974HVP0_XENLA|nr:hypothetical protein XELAEV_18014725mg [Xenopus laevis]
MESYGGSVSLFEISVLCAGDYSQLNCSEADHTSPTDSLIRHKKSKKLVENCVYTRDKMNNNFPEINDSPISLIAWAEVYERMEKITLLNATLLIFVMLFFIIVFFWKIVEKSNKNGLKEGNIMDTEEDQRKNSD